MSDYYKSLITDDEVIKELIKESKRREGRLPTEVTRLKPNLNFFQRTVNSLVSNNNRIDKSKDTFKTEYHLKDCNLEEPETSNHTTYSPSYPKKTTQIDSAFERNMILHTKINFVKSSAAFSSSLATSKAKKKIEIKKISFAKSSEPRRGLNIEVQKKRDIKQKTTSASKEVDSYSIESSSTSTEEIENTHNCNQKTGTILSNSEDGKCREGLAFMLSCKERHTTCKTISSKLGQTEFKDKGKKLHKDAVIFISSDDDLIETLPTNSGDNKKKNKIKSRVKKKKEKHKEQSDETKGSNAKRKKLKKRKKYKVDNG